MEKWITTRLDLLGREPYQTVLDIMEGLDKPVTLPELNKIAKLSKINRVHLYQVLEKLTEFGLITRNPPEKKPRQKNVTYKACIPKSVDQVKRLKFFFPPITEYIMPDGSSASVARISTTKELIKKIKRKPDAEKEFKAKGARPATVAILLEELTQEMWAGFSKKAKLFGIKQDDFEFALEIKQKGKIFYKKKF